MKLLAIDPHLDLAKSYGGVERATGVHMSDLYNHFYAAKEPKRYAKKAGEEQPTNLFGLGMALEEMLEERLILAEGSQRPEPLITPEGIHYSPDLIIMNHIDPFRLGEIKLTFMSTKGAPWVPGTSYNSLDPKFDKYFTQMKCYCKHLGTRHARLYAFFVNEAAPWGDQKRALRCWDVEFTQHEIDEEWQMIYRHAKKEGLLKGL
jgi:hypothetical protein